MQRMRLPLARRPEFVDKHRHRRTAGDGEFLNDRGLAEFAERGEFIGERRTGLIRPIRLFSPIRQ